METKEIELQILKYLLKDTQSKEIIPYLKQSFFKLDNLEIFDLINEYTSLYDRTPSIKDLSIMIEVKGISSDKRKKILNRLKDIDNTTDIYDDFKIDMIEDFIRENLLSEAVILIAEGIEHGNEKKKIDGYRLTEKSFNFSLKKKYKTISEIVNDDFIEDKIYSPLLLPITKGIVTVISSKGGIGKSYLSLRMILQILNDNKEYKGILFNIEDGEKIIKRRVKEISSKHSFTDEPLLRCFFSDEKDMELVKNAIKEFDIVVIDPLVAFINGDENSSSEIAPFMIELQNLSKKYDTAVIVLHHNNKEGGVRGSSAISDNARLVYNLSKDEENTTVTKEKDNYSIAPFMELLKPYRVDFNEGVTQSIIKDSFIQRGLETTTDELEVL